MKKVDQIILDEQDKVEAVSQIPDETQKLFASIVPYKGHTLFEINCTTGEIVPAEYEDVTADFDGKVRRKVIVKDNSLYISCLNKKSAAKKYFNWLAVNIAQQNKK